MINFSFSLLDAEAFTRLDQIPIKVHALLEEKFRTLINELKTKVEENLSGKVLNVKSGVLLSSLRSGVERQGDLLIGFVEIDPPNETVKEYALAHEYGGKGYYWIHVGPKGVLANRETGFFSKHDVFHPLAKERSYLRSAFREMEPEIVSSLSPVIEESIR